MTQGQAALAAKKYGDALKLLNDAEKLYPANPNLTPLIAQATKGINEEKALIAGLHADPRNDDPRLVYADWLAGYDQGELAELIRLTCREPYFDLRMSRTAPWTS